METPEKIYLSSPHLTGKEKDYIQEALDTNWVAPLGPHVDAFEAELCAYTGAKAAAVLSSGTAALHLALILSGVEPGDYVFCQSFTFSASANPIVYQGAHPVFIDSESDSWNMDPQLLQQAIEDLLQQGIPANKLKAVIPVHLYGSPCKMQEIVAIAKQYQLKVIEDAAEALGSTYKQQACGNLGADFGVISFNGNKIITSSGGGVLLSNDAEAIAKARFLATQARDAAPHYQHSHIGYNYRMSNVVAGIGRAQLQAIADRVLQRNANFNRYQARYGKVAGISFQPVLAGSTSNRWLTCMLIDADVAGFSREDLRLAMEAKNIECRPLWKPMHLQPVFAEAKAFCNGVSEQLFNQGLCLPSGSNLTDAQWERIYEVLDQYLLHGRSQ